MLEWRWNCGGDEHHGEFHLPSIAEMLAVLSQATYYEKYVDTDFLESVLDNLIARNTKVKNVVA